MSNVKISTRLWALIIALSFFALVVGFIGLRGMAQTSEALKTVYNDRVVPLGHLEEITRLLARNRVLVMDMIINPVPENVTKRDAELVKNIATIGKIWSDFTATSMTVDEKKISEEFAARRATYVKEGLLPLSEAMKKGQTDDALKIYKEKISPQAPKILELSIWNRLPVFALRVTKYLLNSPPS